MFRLTQLNLVDIIMAGQKDVIAAWIIVTVMICSAYVYMLRRKCDLTQMRSINT